MQELQDITYVDVTSMRQPWSGLLAQGHISIVMRGRTTYHRGEIYIHAPSLTSDRYTFVHDGLGERALDPLTMARRGGVVGKARLIGMKRYKLESEWRSDAMLHRRHMSEYRYNTLAWLFSNMELVPFMFMPGGLGVFKRELRDQ